MSQSVTSECQILAALTMVPQSPSMSTKQLPASAGRQLRIWRRISLTMLLPLLQCKSSKILVLPLKVTNSIASQTLQVYHEYSSACHIAAPEWEKAARSLSKWAGFGRINCCSSLQQRQLVLEMERLHGIDIHMQQLPLVLGLPEGCTTWSCAVRWSGGLYSSYSCINVVS